jgi:ribosomal protein L29
MKKETAKKEKTKKKSLPTSESDLMKELSEKRLKLRDIRFGIAGSKSKNVKEQKMIKKDVARILTKINLISNSPN